MASASSLLSEEQFLCSICLDVFTDPVSTPCGHNYCKACITQHWHTSDVCKCPLCNKSFYRRPELSVNTLISEMVVQFRKLKLKEDEAKDEVQQMIQERRLKIQEVKRSVELSREDADTVVANSVQVFTALISCIQRSQAELIHVIKEKQKTTEKQAEGLIEELQQEITQLVKRKMNPKASAGWRPTKDWTKVLQSSHVGTLRTAVSQLEKTLSEEMKKNLCDVELRMIQRYEVDVTLDPDTAHPELILSEDGKQVSDGDVRKNLPNKKKRFSRGGCVLGKERFSSGMFYYEVQVGGKTDWSLGVARESVNRKRDIKLNPNNGYWTIGLWNGEYEAAAGPAVLIPVREKVQKVGVFVDYEEGLVSFYDVEARVHLYSFTGCSFTERLHPFFLNDSGRNSAPLIISPVNHMDYRGSQRFWLRTPRNALAMPRDRRPTPLPTRPAAPVPRQLALGP